MNKSVELSETPEVENPHFTALKMHCAAKPDAIEDHPWGETVFKLRGKVFAFLGKGEFCGVTVKPQPGDLDGLLALSFVERAPYIGRYGWVHVRIDDNATLDMALDLIDVSYGIIGSKSKKGKHVRKGES